MDHVYNFKHVFNFKKNTKNITSKVRLYTTQFKAPNISAPRQDTLVKPGFGVLCVNRFRLSGLFLLSQKVSLGLITHNIIVHNTSKLGIYATVKG